MSARAPTPHKLTDAERRTLNKAMAILACCTAQRSSWMICAYRYNDLPFMFDVTYFDSNEGSARGQHSDVPGTTFAAKVQSVLDIEAKAEVSAAKNRAARVQALRAELARLEQAA